MKRIRIVISVFLIFLSIAASINLPLYAHSCRTMEQDGVFLECCPGEREAGAGECCRHAATARDAGTHLRSVPCCADHELPHAVLDSGIVPDLRLPADIESMRSNALIPSEQHCSSGSGRRIAPLVHPPPPSLAPAQQSCILLL